ncbi:MAG: cell division protein ZapE [Magnetococcales bacterium]|nr:cell division protein ZapE [Magnetococcales bacterium]
MNSETLNDLLGLVLAVLGGAGLLSVFRRMGRVTGHCELPSPVACELPGRPDAEQLGSEDAPEIRETVDPGVPSTVPRRPSPRELYEERLFSGGLLSDPDQMAVLPQLDALVALLNRPARREDWRGVPVWRPVDGSPPPRGLYMFGPVGRGKSMLMQMVFDAVGFQEKRRVHFHPFMKELHQRLHVTTPPPGVDMMMWIASDISEEARLLCFDEFYVDNIADAILLGRLLEALFKCGVTLCGTSNWAPEDLFRGGFNRQSFMPLLKILRNNIEEVDLARGADWRRAIPGEPLPKEPATPREMFRKWAGEDPGVVGVTLRHTGLTALGGSRGVYWFDFQTLCAQSLGASEYMALTEMARGVILSDLPQLGPATANAAMRLILLVDLLYEKEIPLRTFSATELDKLCTEGPAAFAFKRTVSRIVALRKLLPACPVM